MTPRQQMTAGIAAGVLLVAVLAAVVALQRTEPEARQAVAVPAPAIPGLPAAQPGTATVAPALNQPPPWATSAMASGVSGKDAGRVQALQAIQGRLAALTAGGRTPDPKALDAVLDDLVRTQGTTVIGGVDFAVLKNNLARAQEIERLAKEMEQLAKQPKPDTVRIQALMAQIQTAQAGLRSDVMAPVAATPKR